MRDTGVTHKLFFKVQIRLLTVSLNQLGLRTDKGVVRTEERRVGKEERRTVEEVKKRRGEEDR